MVPVDADEPFYLNFYPKWSNCIYENLRNIFFRILHYNKLLQVGKIELEFLKKGRWVITLSLFWVQNGEKPCILRLVDRCFGNFAK